MTVALIRDKIDHLITTAETGADWAEICELENQSIETFVKSHWRVKECSYSVRDDRWTSGTKVIGTMTYVCAVMSREDEISAAVAGLGY